MNFADATRGDFSRGGRSLGSFCGRTATILRRFVLPGTKIRWPVLICVGSLIPFADAKISISTP